MTKIPIGNHKDRYGIGEKLLMLYILMLVMHSTLETVYWAHNIKLRKIKDLLDPDWINR